MLETLTTWQDAHIMYEWFTQMRATQPVWLDQKSRCWHVFRYEDVLRVTTDYPSFSSEQHSPLQPLASDKRRTANLATIDPPRHRHYRNLISSVFTFHTLAPLSERICSIVQEHLDKARSSGTMDVIADLASPLSSTMIAEILGLPITDQARFKGWADALFSRQVSDEETFHAPEDLNNRLTVQRANAAQEEMNTYIEQMLAERRRHPRNDLMSTLLTAKVEGERLSQDEISSFCTLLLLAGHVTTTSLIGQAVLCLDSHPDAMQLLRQSPALASSAVEEVLRYASPVWRVMRVTRHAVKVAGVTLPANAVIFAWLASANRDETQFSDPESFDIARSPNHHLAFGHGIHFCVGSPLARMEAIVALSMLLAQLRDLQVDRKHPLELYKSRILFGVKKLPITFTPFPYAGKKP